MNGWQRIGAVIGGGITAIAALLGHESNNGAYYTYYPSAETNALKEAAPDSFWPAVWAEMDWQNVEQLRFCDEATIRGNPSYDGLGVTITCDYPGSVLWENAFEYAFITAAILFVIYVVLAWVVAGFRRS